MKYRAEIDGLRALAVISVILFHAGFELFNGGFIGVDVFFVISGYLITTILIEDIENKRFNIVNFYERRARRILPALFFVMLICIPFAWMWMLPAQIENFAQSLVAVSLFASNILFWRESGYFAATAEEKPLLHTWSLAVEEQYYVLFPVFLFLAWRFGKNRVFWIIVAMSVISLLLSEWGWRNTATANFYLATTRAWELFAGSIAAFIVQKKGVRKNNILALLGLAAIVFSIFEYDESTPFPSVYALVPVLGVVLLVLFADQETLAARILSTKAFVGIGLISYSAYLWHQPLFAYARICLFEEPSALLMAVLSVTSLALAMASWKYIEKPFRDKQTIKSRYIWLFSTSGIALFILVGTLGSLNFRSINSGFLNPFNQIQLGAYTPDNRFLQRESWNLLRNLSGNDSYGVYNNSYDNKLWFNDALPTPKILLIGNSHSKDIFNIFFQSEAINSKFQIARYGLQIRNMNKIHAFWDSPNYKLSTHILVATRYDDDDIENLPKVIERIQNDGKQVLIVNNIFEFPGEADGYSLIDEVVMLNRKLSVSEVSTKVNEEYFNYYKLASSNYSFNINIKLANISEKYKISVLNRMDYMCSSEVKLCFAVQQDLTKNLFDYGHHTLKGTSFFAKSKLLEGWQNTLISHVTNE